MRNRVIKIFLIVALPAVGSFFFYKKASYFYEESIALQDKMGYLYDSTDKPDVLFLGSSRTWRHVDPRVIDSICHVNSYNLGVDGLNITEMRMMLHVIIEKGKTPRVLVLNIDPSSLEVLRLYYNYTSILPYAARDTVVYNAMASVQDEYLHRWKYPFYRLLKYSAINDGFKVDAILEGREKFRRRIDALRTGPCSQPEYKGFRPECEGYQDVFMPPFNEPWEEKGFGLLKDISHTCRAHGIRLVLVTAPMYRDYDKVFLNADSLTGRIRLLAGEEKIPYFNMIRDSLSMEKQNFTNLMHLSGRGAELYSARLAYILNRLTRPVEEQ